MNIERFRNEKFFDNLLKIFNNLKKKELKEVLEGER